MNDPAASKDVEAADQAAESTGDRSEPTDMFRTYAALSHGDIIGPALIFPPVDACHYQAIRLQRPSRQIIHIFNIDS